MNDTIVLVLRILGIALTAVGMILVWLAPWIVKKYGLTARKKIDPKLTGHMSEEELEKFRQESAVLDVKLRSLLVALPGLILILIAFR